ncbi:AIR12, DOMON domain [Dillenia turbinata]|uniref:AIR12, DOMON domain n=1 Tax=Dillenia turbinata TaxID=194707 RepID=A0AAN8YZV9_9MAGN
MGTTSRPVLIPSILVCLILCCSAQNCSNHTFLTNREYSFCSDLPFLQAHLHWNYIPSTKTVQIEYRAAQNSTGWIAWAINPTGTGMIGSQALVAFLHSNGSMVAYPTPIASYIPSMKPGTLSYPVSNISAEYSNNEMAIFAIIGPLSNGTTVNHVWQAGNSVSNDIPHAHPLTGPNLQSMGTLDFLAG